METEEVIKLVDNIYKNILDKFNPGARQLISAGKAYLKALHGTAAASRVFNEALAKIAVNAQQGGTTDIGSALMNIVGVYKDIQDQHMNILKAFYVDLLVPLETNLEKDTKVVQFEQKKFLQQHKIRADSYSKATATMKKQRKKKGNAQNADKEIKSIQAMDEEKNKLDAFCEQSLKNAMTQERRRYGFVLERQCSLAKHWIAYHSAGKNFILNSLDNWEEVSASREFLPPNMENVFARQMIMDMSNEHEIDDESDRGSVISAIRKTRSIDASCLDMRSIGDVVNSSVAHMPRAKSEFNLTSSAVEAPKWDQRTISRGLYAYLSSGENQLSFLEGDRIALVGDRAKGWQFGENLRTHTFGWFPVAYTELEQEDNHNNWGAPSTMTRNGSGNHSGQQQQYHQQQHHQSSGHSHQQQQQSVIAQRSHSIEHQITPDSSLESTVIDEPVLPVQLQQAYHEDASPTRMFGDTIMYRQSKQFRRVSGGVATAGGPKPGPPPTLPAPVPTPVVPASYPSGSAGQSQMNSSKSFSSNGNGQMSNAEKRKSMPANANYNKPVSSSAKPKSRNGVAVNNASLHSSNDSGFANEPAPPQPDIDYSDDETVARVPIRSHQIARSPSTVNTSTTNTAKRTSRIPTRRTNDSDTLPSNKKKTSPATATIHSASTLSRPTKTSTGSNHNIRQSSSYGNLVVEEHHQQQLDADLGYLTTDRKNGNLIKRTKSFWKFGKSDDILEGMAMWKHRDLVPPEGDWELDGDSQMDESSTLRRPRQKVPVEDVNTLGSAHSSETLKNGPSSNGEYVVQASGKGAVEEIGNKYRFTKSEIDHRVSAMQQTQQRHQQQVAVPQVELAPHALEYETQEEEDESIYDVQPKVRQQMAPATQVMSRGKVLRQAYLEDDMAMEEDLRRIPSTRNQEKYRNSRNDNNIYGVHTNNNNNLISTSTTNTTAAISATSTSKKKKKTAAKTSAPVVEHIEYYAVRAETPDTINQDEVFESALLNENTVRMRDTNFYDDESGDDAAMMMKTVKRQDILKQYYNSSGSDDTEHHSTSSDAYDCIVVEDHHVVRRAAVAPADVNGKSGKMEFKTFRGGSDDKDSGMESSRPGTLLPRTKLAKTNSNGNTNGTSAANIGQTAAVKVEKQKRSRGDRSSGNERKETRDRDERTDRNGNRIERNDRGERGDRGDRNERGDRIDRSDRGDRNDRGDRMDRNDRGERNDRIDRGERGDRNDRDRIDRGDRNERIHERNDKPVDRSNADRQDRAPERGQQRHDRNEQYHHQQHRPADLESLPSVKSYGPWYDLWGKDITVQK